MLLIYKLISTEMVYAFRDTSQAGITLSSMSVSVNFCNCKVHPKLKSMVLCLDDMMHQRKGEKGTGNYVRTERVHPGFTFTLTGELSRSEKNLCLVQSQMTWV